MNQVPPLPAVNRTAIISLVSALLTIFSFCIAVAPIPLTGYLCYPAAALLGLLSLLTGIIALSQIKATKEDGRTYALIGVWVGGLALLASLCAITLGILLFPKVVALIHQVLNSSR